MSTACLNAASSSSTFKQHWMASTTPPFRRWTSAASTYFPWDSKTWMRTSSRSSFSRYSSSASTDGNSGIGGLKVTHQYIDAILERITIPYVLMAVVLTTNSDQDTVIVGGNLPVVRLEHVYDFIMMLSTVILFGSFLEVFTEGVEFGSALRFPSTGITFCGVSVIVSSF